MKQPDRTKIVKDARRDISSAIVKAMDKYDLTDAEIVLVLAQEILITARYTIRNERHGACGKDGKHYAPRGD